MKNLVVLFLLFSTLAVVSQESNANAKPKWILGFGSNIIDNTATAHDQYLNASDQWNYVPTVSKVSFERIMSEQFSIEGSIGINELSSDKMQNGTTLKDDQSYFGFDLNGKFYFGKEFIKYTAFDPYIVAGFGLNKVGDNENQSSNLGLGFNLWLNSNVGLRLQTLGKYGFTQNTLLNNHIQHSAELVLKF
ncbi:MAG: hypothetical protein EXR18_07615 [Flavobacteriaceae bacterium]|nr:hypothetical protein [Flavobacteriaceae bacterium]